MNKIFLTHATIGEGGAVNPEASKSIRAYLAELPAGTETLIAITPKGAIAGALGIIPLERVLEDLTHLDNLTRRTIDHTNVTEVLDFLNELSTWLPYSGRLQANCKYYLLSAEAMAFDRIPEDLKGTSERNEWRRAQAAEYAAMYEQAVRICSAITHRCDHLRTFISYEKTVAGAVSYPAK